MTRFDTSNTAGLEAAIARYLAGFSADIICPVQVWYEAFGGFGAPLKSDADAIAAVLAKTPGWKFTGDTRYEKYGSQPTYTRMAGQTQPAYADDEHYAVQHLFKVGGTYRTPEGRKYKIALSEVYNLRCFEVDDKGNMSGGMVKIHPKSELAKQLTVVS